MGELLEQALREGFVGNFPLPLMGARTAEGFAEAWDAAWALMKSERAYPHRTEERKQWQKALRSVRPEFEACYLRVETAYSRLHVFLLKATNEPRTPDAGVLVAELVA